MKTKEKTSKGSKPVIRKVSRGYQITLPPEFREKAHVTIGDHVRIEQQGDVLIITAVSDRRQQIADELAAALAEPTEGGEGFDDEEAMRFAIDQVKRYREEKKKKSLREK
jgi:bifunctional DNA-binding transcriptional regulator/antitoxin component of YhaV-PrlF toxin-antitoxin module